MTTILEALNWRYATKKFDPTKKISDEDLNLLLEVLHLAPTSYGLQPYKFLLIENKAIREKLKEKSDGQQQLTEASHLIVFCSYLSIENHHIDAHMNNTQGSREIEDNALLGYSSFLKRTMNQLDLKTKLEWNSKQAYIALGFLLHACAQLRIDSTPMEGFDAIGYDEVLNLKPKNLHAVIVCPIGYRSESDETQYWKKIRKSQEELIEIIE
jgi:nitroreductase